MRDVRRRMRLPAALLALLLAGADVAMAQVATTTVQDTVYTANGTPASGTVLLSWSAFTTAGGVAVAAGTTSVSIGAGGVLTVALAPNAGATPMGSYYTAVLHLSDGTTSRQYWVVPVTVPGGGPAKLAAIQNQVLPTSVAMQTVSKQYVDNAIAGAMTGYVPPTSSPFLLKAGDAMTGPLVLPGDPASALQAADKNYVDEKLGLFGPSGAGHAQGLVPDPGATAGATRFLREDGSWAAPAGGGSGGGGTMATQNANAVTITGGSIDGTVIGATTRANGQFSGATIGVGNDSMVIGQYPATGFAAAYYAGVSPSNSNYIFLSNGADSRLNGTTYSGLFINNVSAVDCTSSGCTFAQPIATSNGFSGTKTAGSCALTIVSGIITNVTGC